MKNEESECRIIIIMKVVKKSKFEIDKYNCFMRKKKGKSRAKEIDIQVCLKKANKT